MKSDSWDAKQWVEEFERCGGVVLPTCIVTNLSDHKLDQLKLMVLCAEIHNDDRWELLMSYANSPERVDFQHSPNVTLAPSMNPDDRLMTQDYFDAMAKYKGKPSNFPVPDMCLELIQRDYFGLLDQEMEFSEASLAVCLRDIADNSTTDSVASYFLDGLANALDGAESPWQIKVTRKKWAGKFKSISNSESERSLWALAVLEHYEAQGWPTEAAIAKVGERLGGLRRASTFNIIKNGRRLRKMLDNFPIEIEKSTD